MEEIQQKEKPIEDLREDEIEALLKFEGVGFLVYVAEGDWVNGNQKYVAVIFLPTSSDGPFISQLSARGPNRVKAVNAVWKKYNQYKKDTKGREEPHVGWYVEEANAKIEVELHKTIFNNGETNE